MKRQSPTRNSRCRCLHGAIVVVLLIAGTQPALAQQNGKEFDALSAAIALERTFVKVIADAEKSVVSIARIDRSRPPRIIDGNNGERTDPDSADFIPNEFGSGVIIAPLKDGKERVILTNYHVVKGGPVDKQADRKATASLYVRLANRRGFYAKIIAADPRADLAVLKIDYAALKMKPEEVRPMPLGKRNDYRKGQLVLALGNPYAQARDGSASASWGMISNISRRPKPVKGGDTFEGRKKDTLHHLGTLLQVDTRLNLGFSGGALLNLKGELIGLTTSLAALEGYETSVGYAVPLDDAMRRIVRTLAQGHEVEYGYLGVTPQDITPDRLNELPRRLRRQFATLIIDVHRYSPAARSGLKIGDVVLAVDDQPIYNRYDLMRRIGRLAPETKTKLKVWRSSGRRELTLTVQLGKWPVINDEDIIATIPRYPEWRGLTVDHPTARHKFLQRPYSYRQAVVVLSMKNEALKKQDKLQPGDYITHVNGTPVETPREFYQAVKNEKGQVKLKLFRGATVQVSP